MITSTQIKCHSNKINFLYFTQYKQNSRRRPIRGLLHVSGDGLRVVDDDTKGLIVDQTIEKVSFCAPDRNHERGFSYICRDGTTRRWMCHGFLASKDSGERLSHAVGCAFTVCLERKQRRDTECSVSMTFDKQNSTFTRNGSFRQTMLTDRLHHHNERGIDVGGNGNGGGGGNVNNYYKSPSAVVAPQPRPHNPYAIERPHATPSMLERQGSFRGLSSLNSQSPFKRQMSLRLSDLPSNAERQRSFLEPLTNGHTIRTVSPIPEIVPQPPSSLSSLSSSSSQNTQSTNQQPEIDVVSALCKELSQGLSMLTRNDNGDELNFNLQTLSTAAAAATTTTTTAPTSDYVLPSAVSADAISKIAPISPVEVTPSITNIVAVRPFASSGYIPMDGTTTTITTAVATTNSIAPATNVNTVAPISYIPAQRHRASVSGALPTQFITHNLQTAADNEYHHRGDNDFSSSTKTPATAIVATNTQLPRAEQWLGQIVRNASPASKRASLHTRAKSLTTDDPFNAEWVASVTSKIDEVTKISAAATEQPIIKHTNPFISPMKQVEL